MEYILTHINPRHWVLLLIAFSLLRGVAILILRSNNVYPPKIINILYGICSLKFEFSVLVIASFMVANGIMINIEQVEYQNIFDFFKLDSIAINIGFVWGVSFLLSFFIFYYCNRFLDSCIKKLN